VLVPEPSGSRSVSDHPPADKTFTGHGKSLLQFSPAEKDSVIAAHAAPRSNAAR
jgi:hypothetical protein